MKKTIALLLSLLLAVSICLLSGCSDKENKGETNSANEGVDSESFADNPTDFDGDSPFEDSSASEDTLTEVTTKEQVKLSYKELYNGVLKDYYNYILNFKESDEIPFGKHGVAEIAKNCDSPSETLTRIGYLMKDLNKDGTPELLIGPCDDEEGLGASIFTVFTCVDNKAHILDEGWYRSRYYLMTDGTLFYYSSSGSAYQSFGTFGISENLQDLKCKQFYFSDSSSGSQLYYTNSTGDEEPANSKTVSRDAFWDEYERLTDKTIEFKLTVFSKMKNS